MIYIAGPFFNESELDLIESIEDKCGENNIPFFSPRLEGGILKDMTTEERAREFLNIYDMNVKGIDDSDALIAVIDNFDAGTMFEIGYAAKANKRIISITNNNYGLNVMLSKPVEAHTGSVEDAVNALLGKPFNNLKIEVTT